MHVIGSSWVLSGDQGNSPHGVQVQVVSICVLFIGIEEVCEFELAVFVFYFFVYWERRYVFCTDDTCSGGVM